MAFQAYLTSTTNYTEAPTGLIENQTFEEWASKNQMEIVSRDGNTVKLEAEWGNGEGVDTYEVELLDTTVTVTTELDETFEIDGIEFSVSTNGRSILITLLGGYGYSELDQDWVEVDADFIVASIDIDDNNIDIDGEFEITITVDELRQAKAYRADYPAELPV